MKEGTLCFIFAVLNDKTFSCAHVLAVQLVRDQSSFVPTEEVANGALLSSLYQTYARLLLNSDSELKNFSM